MSSVMSKSFKQTNGYFAVLTSTDYAKQFKVDVPASGAGGDYKPGKFIAYADATVAPALAVGTLLKDMGKTVVSSSHVFRKVQAVVAGAPSIIATTPSAGLPFYVELSNGTAQTTAPALAYLPGLF